MSRKGSIVKVSFPPFIHSGFGENAWYQNIIYALAPFFIFLFIYRPYLLAVTVFAALGFWTANKSLKLFFNENFPAVRAQFILWGIFYGIFSFFSLPPLLPVFIFSALSYGLLKGVFPSKKIFFPSFALALILTYSFLDSTFYGEIFGHYFSVLLLSAGILFIFFKRILFIRIMGGVITGSALSYIFTQQPNWGMPLLLAFILSCPGIIPPSGIKGFFMAMSAGILSGFFGPPGIFIYFIIRRLTLYA